MTRTLHRRKYSKIFILPVHIHFCSDIDMPISDRETSDSSEECERVGLVFSNVENCGYFSSDRRGVIGFRNNRLSMMNIQLQKPFDALRILNDCIIPNDTPLRCL